MTTAQKMGHKNGHKSLSKPPWHSLNELQGDRISKIELLGWIESLSHLKNQDSGKYGRIFRFLVKEEQRKRDGNHSELIALMREIRADVELGLSMHVHALLLDAETYVDSKTQKKTKGSSRMKKALAED